MQELIKDLPAALKDRASWLINAGADDTARGLASMTGTEDDMRILRAAIATEEAGANRSSRLKPMQATLRKHSDAVTAQSLEVITQARESHLVKRARELKEKRLAKEALTPPSKRATTVTVDVVTPKEAVLTDAAKALAKHRDIILKQEQVFFAATIGSRLQIGLHCLKAHTAFAIQDQAKRGAMKGKKSSSRRDELSTGGFEGWLAAECQWLKKPTAYKYMTAVRGLGLDHDSTEKQVAAALKLKLRKGPVTIKSLCLLALDTFGPDAPPDSDSQTEFAFLKNNLSHFREEVENLCNMKEKLHAYPDFHRAATARLYSALYELTGTHWAPSDEPDSLALVDPDAIKI
jgi:hypothetical protein